MCDHQFIVKTILDERILKYADIFTIYRYPICQFKHIEILSESKEKWQGFSRNPNVRLKHLRKYKDKPWNWIWLSSSFTINEIFDNLDLPWDHRILSGHPGLTVSHIKKYFDLVDWGWKSLSWHNNITIDDIKAHIDWPWCWKSVGSNKNITLDVIRDNPDLPWSYSDLTYKLSSKDIIDLYRQKNNDQDWDWKVISKKEDVTIELIRDNLDLPWNWDKLTINNAIKLHDIFENLTLPWNMEILKKHSKMEDLTVNMFLKNDVYLNLQFNIFYYTGNIYTKLMADLFLNKETFVDHDDYKKHKAALIIQRQWKESITNPAYQLCKKRLFAEFCEL